MNSSWEWLSLVKVKPTKGRLLPENSLCGLEGRPADRSSSLFGSNVSKLEISSGLETEGMNGGRTVCVRVCVCVCV